MSPDLPSVLQLRVITTHNLLVETEADEVTIPSLEGYLGILPGHRPLFTALGRGTLSYRVGKKGEKLSIRGGYAEILPEKVIVFTELSDEED
ncbi:MAG: F0F1 ATP synthase subunit epsilon [Acidobacteriota bacterium]